MSQINRIRHEQRSITIAAKEILESIRKFLFNPYSIELKKKLTIFCIYVKPLKLNQEHTNNLNRPLTDKKTEAMIKGSV